MSVTELARAKATILEHYQMLDNASDHQLTVALAKHADPACRYHFVHPFNDVTGPEQAAEIFWAPLRSSFAPLQRRQNIFMAGRNDLDGGATLWVVSMGHLLVLFDKPFLGMRPTRQSVMLRYAEFNCVADSMIVESAMFLDIMNLMAQVRAEVMPASTAATMVTPGPRTQDGLLFNDQPAAEGKITLNLYQRMINRLLSVDVHTTETDLSLDWTDDMIWWGPGGIGAPYTQQRYLEQHCTPFEQGLEWGDFFGHTTELESQEFSAV